MNERIKELWLQSAREDAGDTWDSQTEFIERFAKLIVRECIAKVEIRKNFAIEDEHTIDHAFDLLVYDIESHFGVK